MKKICFFSGDITRNGGTERVSTTIANELIHTGLYQISFLSLVEQNDTPFFFISPKIKRYVLKKDKKWIQPGPGYIKYIPKLRYFLKKHRPDLITDIDIVLDILTIPASIGLPVKVISWEHFHYYFEQESLYRRIIAKITAHFSDYIITLTPQDKLNYQKKLRRKDSIDFIYNPIPDYNKFNFTSYAVQKKKIIITIGRLNYIKGTDMLARIVPRILCCHKDWKWYFLGDGELKPLLEKVIQTYHLEKQLILPGAVKNVESYLKRASICVLASRTESFGICLLEAKCCQVPCISFDVLYGPSILIDQNINGFLVQPFNLTQMAEQIVLLMENDNLRNQFSKNTINGLEQFKIDIIIKKWKKILAQL